MYLVELIVNDPNVLVPIVGADLDLMRPSAARFAVDQCAEERLGLWPVVDFAAMAINHEDRMVPAAFPSALARGAAPSIEAVAVPSRVTPIGRSVWGARLGVLWEREFATLRDPDTIW